MFTFSFLLLDSPITLCLPPDLNYVPTWQILSLTAQFIPQKGEAVYLLCA